MLSEAELDRVCVVLVRARNPSNIGAVARAMHDFGFKWLKVVNEFPVPFEAAKSAVDASEVMANAVMCASLAEAVGDCTLVVGTTAVGERDVQHHLLPLAGAAPKMRSELERETGRVALLFGSEKTGLSNEELSHCNWLLTVPMHEHPDARHPSMNLGQAVAVCLYELVRDAGVAEARVEVRIEPQVAPVSGEDAEHITRMLLEVLEKSGYTNRITAVSTEQKVRRWVRRLEIRKRDAPLLLGFLRQILWKFRN